MKDTVLADRSLRQKTFDLSEMELIEVLWRQDIDLGIGREMFDSSLRQELEKEPDYEQKEQEEESKKEDNSKAKVDSGSFPVLDLSGNYVVDGETGELVPGPVTSEPEPVDGMDFFDFDDILPGNLELPNLDSVRSLNDGLHPVLDNVHSLDGDFPSLELLDTPQVQLQPRRDFEEPQLTQLGGTISSVATHRTELSRQNSLEQRWEDVLGLLDFPDFSIGYGTDGMNLPAMNCPVSQPVVQNVSFANLTTHDPLLLSRNYPLSSASSFPLFPETDMNVTYPLISAQLMMNTSASVMPSVETNSSFVNMDTTPSRHLVTTSFDDLQEANNISEFSSAALESLFQHIFDDNNTYNSSNTNLADTGFSFEEPSNTASHPPSSEEMSTDSPISMQRSPVMQWFEGMVDQNDGADEAAGGKDIISTCDMDFEKYQYNAAPNFHSQSPCLEANSSASLNETSFRPSKSLTKHVYHNHTYVLQPGQVTREEKEEAIKREKEQKATRSRDEKKAKEMKLPFSIDVIINTPVEDFTQMLSRYSLSEAQQQLIRDIRRRGKNKQAAQNCRKRKLDVIQTLEQEVDDLHKEHNSLLQTRRHLDRETAQVKDKLVRLQAELFRSLRDDSGQPYNPNEYSLQQLPDGNLFLVPKNNTDKAPVEKPGRKRKPKKKKVPTATLR